jgi:tRNA G37 N-methylase Trm5
MRTAMSGTTSAQESLSTRLSLTFAQRKSNCLLKTDKSSAGQIDAYCVDLCDEINKRDEFYTTSSCSGRCFIYCGTANKSSAGKDTFQRFRVHHEHVIKDPKRYFNMKTLPPPNFSANLKQSGEEYDLTGGGDSTSIIMTSAVDKEEGESLQQSPPVVWWLSFQPFILHVCCRTLEDARNLINTCRHIFKNVGLTSWKEDGNVSGTIEEQFLNKKINNHNNKVIVAIWGDEGLNMPLTSPHDGRFLYEGLEQWLAGIIHSHHLRNYEKMQKLMVALKQMISTSEDAPIVEQIEHSDENTVGADFTPNSDKNTTRVRSFEVIGDVALLHGFMEKSDGDTHNMQNLAASIMSKNKAIKIVAVRTKSLSTEHRSSKAGDILILAGPERVPLITTHTEYGISCPVDLSQVFFSTRLAKERFRICQQVAQDERVLCLFSGVGMEALQIAALRGARQVYAIEKNPVAAECARRGLQTLSRNKKYPGASGRVHLFEGDVVELLPLWIMGAGCTETEPLMPFDRILAPRPKETVDGDLDNGKGSGIHFLELLLPLLRTDGGKCHWYDFCADHELPDCLRTRTVVQEACRRWGYEIEIVEVVNAGSVAKRQYRICMDFKVISRFQSR